MMRCMFKFLCEYKEIILLSIKMSFTCIREIYLELMLTMELNTFYNVCKSSSYLNEICSNDYFWAQKVLKDFGKEVSQHKPAHETWREQYEKLF